LTKLLREVGFEPAIVQRRQAHLQVEFGTALMLMLSWLAPRLTAPWRRPPSRLEAVKNQLIWFFGFAFVPISMLLDAIGAPLLPKLGISNAYRVVARRDRLPLPQRRAEVIIAKASAEAQMV